MKDEFIHRAYSISPISFIEYNFDENFEFYDPVEVQTEITDYVKVVENFGSYFYRVSTRSVLSPILDVDATYEVATFDTSYNGIQNVTIIYTSKGKQGFFSSDTGEFSDAKYINIYISPEKTHGVAKLYSDESKYVVINLRDPNQIIASAEEIIPSNEIVEPIATDYWNEEYKDSLLFTSEFFMLRDGNQYGILSNDLYFYISPQFESISQSTFSESLLLVSKNGLYGYIDLNHRNILKPSFATIPDVSFSEQFPYLFAYIAGSDTKTGMDGNLYPIDYYSQYIGIKDEENDSQYAEWGIKFCNINVALLKFISNPEMSFLENDFDMYGYYTFSHKKKYGISNKFGEMLVPPNYSRIDDAFYFEGKSEMILQSVSLRTGKKTGLYLPINNRIIEPLYDWLSPTYSFQHGDFKGWVINQKGKKGFMTPEGDVVLSCSFKHLDLAELSVNRRSPLIDLKTTKGLLGIANTQGDIIIEPIYETLEFFELNQNDSSWVFFSGWSEKKNFLGVIGSEDIVEIQDYEEFTLGEEFLYRVHCILDFRNEKYGLLAPNNEEIFPFEFESIMIDNHFSLTNYTVVVG